MNLDWFCSVWVYMMDLLLIGIKNISQKGISVSVDANNSGPK